MNRNYKTIRQISQTLNLAKWADARETSLPVAAAIHAIADDRRDANAIWEAPTHAEYDHVEMALQEYADHGDCNGGIHNWGEETITVYATA